MIFTRKTRGFYGKVLKFERIQENRTNVWLSAMEKHGKTEGWLSVYIYVSFVQIINDSTNYS